MKSLVCAGEILVEIMAVEVGQSFLEAGPLVGPFPSGAPAIFIGQAAALGQQAALIGAVGDDDFGAVNINRLRALGADVSAIAVHPGQATGSAFVTYAADGSRRFVYNIAHSAAGLVAVDGAGRRLLATADHFHVMGTSLGTPNARSVIRAGIEAVKARGGSVSFDPNLRRELLRDPEIRAALDFALSRTDLFLPSGDEIYLFTQARDEAAAAAELLDRGVRTVVVKKGAAGASLHDRAGRCDAPGFAVDEVDPTGAGDCFGAAFVTEWLRATPSAAALRLANACGALAVTRKGPMEGIASRADAEALVAGGGR